MSLMSHTHMNHTIDRMLNSYIKERCIIIWWDMIIGEIKRKENLKEEAR